MNKSAIRITIIALLSLSGLIYGGTKGGPGPVDPPEPPAPSIIWHQIPLVTDDPHAGRMILIWGLYRQISTPPNPPPILTP